MTMCQCVHDDYAHKHTHTVRLKTRVFWMALCLLLNKYSKQIIITSLDIIYNSCTPWVFHHQPSSAIISINSQLVKLLWILPWTYICIDHTDDCRHPKIHKHKRPDVCVCVFLRICVYVSNLTTGFVYYYYAVICELFVLLRFKSWPTYMYYQIFSEQLNVWGGTVGAGMVVLDIERQVHRLLFFSPVIIQFSKLAPVLSMLLERVGLWLERWMFRLNYYNFLTKYFKFMSVIFV